ncbi:MAG: extracellular solute-binding protein [candidate division WS1 bacterium]|jgi:ABC-type glycerol-3-phosphate transport system substrate-binding protein|nr:extracellular solute-binding protein [candidate division WS1 bacterium]
MKYKVLTALLVCLSFSAAVHVQSSEAAAVTSGLQASLVGPLTPLEKASSGAELPVRLAAAETEEAPLPPGHQRHLQLALWYDGPAANLAPLNAIIALFEKQHPDIRVHLNPHPTMNAYAKLNGWCGLDEANAPDLAVINSSWLALFAPRLASLDELERTPAAARLLAPALELMKVNGRLLAVPWCLGARVLLVRPDLLAERRLSEPQNWGQMALITAPGLHRPPQVWGMGLPGAAGGGGAVLLQEMLWAEGERVIEAHGGVNLATPGKIKTLERFCELARYAQPEVLSWSQTELENAFGEGRMGLLVSDTWVAQAWQKIEGAPEYRALPLPGGEQPVADVLGDGLAVFARSQHQAAAVRFAHWVMSGLAQKNLMAWGGLAVHQDLLAEAREDPVIGAVIPTMAKAQGGAANAPPAALRALDYAIYLAVSGKQPPAEALALAQKVLAGSMTTTPGAPPG